MKVNRIIENVSHYWVFNTNLSFSYRLPLSRFSQIKVTTKRIVKTKIKRSKCLFNRAFSHTYDT